MNLIPGLRTPTRDLTLLHYVISVLLHAPVRGVLRSLATILPERFSSHASTSTVILSITRGEGQAPVYFDDLQYIFNS